MLAGCMAVNAQNVGIGTSTPHASAALEVSGSSQGILIPRVAFASRPAAPAAGLLIYQTDNTPGFYYYDGAAWKFVGSGTVNGSGSNGQVAVWNGANSVTGSGNLTWDAAANRLNVSSTNNGTPAAGFTNWVAGNFGGSGGNRVVMGVQNGEATIAAHTNDLSNWAKLVINPGGPIAIGSLAGAGTRMVVAATNGDLSTQPITGNDNLGNHTATQNIQLNNNWLGNNGGGNGIRIDNNGNVGVQIIPTGLLDVAKQTNTFNGTFNLFSTVGYAVVAPNADASYPGSNTFDQNDNTAWKPVNTVSVNTPVVTLNLGPGNVQMFRRFSFKSYCGLQPVLNPNFRIRYVIEASNDNATYIPLYSSALLTLTDVGTFNTFDFLDITLNNNTAYQYYRVRMLNMDFFSNATGWVESTEFFLRSVNFDTEAGTTTYSSGALTVLSNGNVGVGTNTPTANLDVVGTLRFRNGAANGAFLISDASGNATWTNTLNASITGNINGTLNGNITGGTAGNFALNNNYLSNNGSATGIRIDNAGNVGIGLVPGAASKLQLSGTGGLKVNTTNAGTGTADWIGINAGGTAGDRFVGGLLNGVPTLGGHTNALNAWSHLVLNPGNAGNATVTIGSDANLSPVIGTAADARERKLVVNGSVRQSVYTTAVSIPANDVTYIYWNHNMGYGPLTMYTTDQNGGGGNMDYVTVTTFNNNTNQTVFVLRNSAGTPASGTLRWILVW